MTKKQRAYNGTGKNSILYMTKETYSADDLNCKNRQKLQLQVYQTGLPENL